MQICFKLYFLSDGTENTGLNQPEWAVSAGFSLIEMLLVLSILSIMALLSIGYFSQQSVDLNRKNAQMHLLAFAQKLHQYQHQHDTYAGASLALYAEVLPPQSPATQAHYRLSMNLTDRDQGFIITAEPINLMSGDGALTINQYGDKRWYRHDQAGNNAFVYW